MFVHCVCDITILSPSLLGELGGSRWLMVEKLSGSSPPSFSQHHAMLEQSEPVVAQLSPGKETNSGRDRLSGCGVLPFHINKHVFIYEHGLE